METVMYKFQENIPVADDVDVLVVGAGPGGLGAGVLAARSGAKTLVVERYGAPGGMSVFGEVTPFMMNHTRKGVMDRPVFVEWRKRMFEYHAPCDQRNHPFERDEGCPSISKVESSLAMEDLLLEAGAKLLYHHTLFDLVQENGKITAAVFHSKSGLCAVRAKMFVDATGDGDLAVLAGAPFEFGNRDGFCQPMTTCFKLSNIDKKRMPTWQEIDRMYNEAKANGEIDCLRENVLWFDMPEDDLIHFNTTRIIKKSAVIGTELSDAEIEGRRQIRQFLTFLRRHVPGFENARLHSFAHHVGVRESRRIKGLVYQTAEDFMNAAKYPDGIARCNYDIDIHNPQGTGTHIVHMKDDDWVDIRYGTIVPQNTKNVLMACRAISVDHELHSSTRVMPPVCSVGQAAGIAAVLCLRKNCTPSELDGAEVRKALMDAGAVFE